MLKFLIIIDQVLDKLLNQLFTLKIYDKYKSITTFIHLNLKQLLSVDMSVRLLIKLYTLCFTSSCSQIIDETNTYKS